MTYDLYNYLQANKPNIATTQVSTPMSTQISNPPGSNTVTIPPGFTIPPSYVQTQAASSVPMDPNSSSHPIFTSAPLNPGIPPSSSVSVDLSGSTNSTAHLFSSPTAYTSPSEKIFYSFCNRIAFQSPSLRATRWILIFYSISYKLNFCGSQVRPPISALFKYFFSLKKFEFFVAGTDHSSYQTMSNIPGMPQSSPLPPLPFDINAPSNIPSINSPVQNYNPIPTPADPSTLPYTVPQSQIVTPISLPGMPPITVSAVMPQNPSFYPTVRHQSQIPTSNTVPPPTSAQ